MKTVAAALILGGVIVTTACAGDISIENRDCPCIPGYVCCDHLCTTGNLCPAGESRTDISTGQTVDAEVIPVATISVAGQMVCSTLVGDSLLWVDKPGKIGGINVATGRPLLIANFALPADPVANCAFTHDANDVYVTLYETGTLLQLSFDGTTLGAQSQRFGGFAHPGQLLADDANIYVIENDSGRVARIAKPANGKISDAVTIGQASPNAHDLIADGDALYWLDGFGLRKLPKNGSDATTLVATPGDSASSLLLTNGLLYWLATTTPYSVPPTGGTRTRLSLSVVTHGQTHSIDDSDDNTVYSLLAGAGELQTDGRRLLIPLDGHVYAIAFDGKMLPIVEDDRLASAHFFDDGTRFVWASASNVFVRPAL